MSLLDDFKKNSVSEPNSDTILKEYIVGCSSSDDWDYIHAVITKSNLPEEYYDIIPSLKRDCVCVDFCNRSKVRGTYLLNDREAQELRQHPKVSYVHVSASAYPATYKDDPDTLRATRSTRYQTSQKHCKDIYGNMSAYIPNEPGIDLINRGAWNLKRHTQKIDPWYGINDGTILDDVIYKYGTGKNIDVIVADDDAWYGHVEFQNNTGNGPKDYVGGNVLPGNGSCDLLDLVLDAPYYIDPDFFNADPNNRLMSRWDGTTVPIESVARNWWGNNNTSYRSSKFVSSSNGGSATGNNDFGTVTVSSTYTRARCNGDNNNANSAQGYHGTPCCSQTYGRQYGWAYNANKWHINAIGYYSVSFESYFDILKIFHQCKPYGFDDNRDPTISSNSWGYRHTPLVEGYYHYRTAVTPLGVGASVGIAYTSGDTPKFMSYFMDDERAAEVTSGHAALDAGKEMIDAGVIFVAAAGNQNQKTVSSIHPDYNNYYSENDNTYFRDATSTGPSGLNYQSIYNSLNRLGFPLQIGNIGIGTTVYNRTIAIGALDDDNGTGTIERKTSYSSKGELVDCFAAADYTLASCDKWITASGFTTISRYEESYTGAGMTSYDSFFSGTSSACPIAVGLLATKLEHNRNWGFADLKNWLQDENKVGLLTDQYLYHGTETTTANDSNFMDLYNLDGAAPRVIWDVATGNEPAPPDNWNGVRAKINTGSGLVIRGLKIQAK